jgi:hypothetical protein
MRGFFCALSALWGGGGKTLAKNSNLPLWSFYVRNRLANFLRNIGVVLISPNDGILRFLVG